MALTVVDHPLVADRVAQLRDVATDAPTFRRLASELTAFLTYEATRTLETVATEVRTPLEVEAPARRLKRPGPVIVPILRAGLGLLDGVLTAIPSAEVGVLGLRRDEETFEPRQYALTLPADMAGRDAIVLDPMLATGGSLVAAFDILRKWNTASLTAICIIGAPEGVQRVLDAHPDAHLVLAALDPGLNERAFIVPGLGDAGDRLFGIPG